ncbi:DUF3492 domain-containing protein [Streptomyces sp. JJ36]|uniref:DUF3492 domain-containing protein n=1 Tax=Streptomyces sp. JJ36 TaxID=2736645 RepID=UPI001F2C7BCB|nr:DUF3492 domain-containing protein [Streptomyces sp. JJ36]MCF6526431.1 DUF3492 domain-containing protein [Streptomyces sp. JJ36]
MRVALLTEGGYPFARGESVLWCDRLLRGLPGHEFEVYALSRGERQERAGWCALPENVGHVRVAPLWGAAPAPGGHREGAAARGLTGRRERRRFAECFAELASAVCTADPEQERERPPGGAGADRADAGGAAGAVEAGSAAGRTAPAERLADRFAGGLYGLAALAREQGGLPAALRSEQAVRLLESACRARGALRAVHSVQVAEVLAVADRLERALRPLSCDWFEAGGGGAGLAAADLCHAVGAGPAALAGLLARRFHGTPLLVTEYGVRLREHYLSGATGPAGTLAPAVAGAPVRALLASFQGRLAREAYARAQLVTPGNTHVRRWQERCGAPRERLRTVYPGMDAAPFAAAGEEAAGARDAVDPAAAGVPTLVWVGRVEPAKDLVGLLHAFAEVRRVLPGARLRIVASRPGGPPEAAGYAAHCRTLAARLFPDEAADARTAGADPVSFEEVGGPALPALTDAYAAGSVVVLSSVVEGFPVSLVEAMFAGRATVSTDVGAVCEVIGGTGLVVPPRNPRALAEACLALLRDPARRARLGAAARARALELFTVEQNTEAFRGIYLELMSHSTRAGSGGSLPFGRPAESHVPGRWAGGGSPAAAGATSRSSGPRLAARLGSPGPSWARRREGAV